MNNNYRDECFYKPFYEEKEYLRTKIQNELFSDTKHYNDELKYEKVINALNLINKLFLKVVFKKFKFGYFSNVEDRRKSKKCQLSILNQDANYSPEQYSFQASKVNDIFEGELVLIDINLKKGIPLYPLIILKECNRHEGERHMYLFNKKNKNNQYVFISLGFPRCTIKLEKNDDEELYESLEDLIVNCDYNCDYFDFRENRIYLNILN